MTRWKHFPLRLTLVTTGLLAAFVTKDVWVHKMLVHQAQSITGARLDVGHVKSNLAAGELLLSDLQLADPHDPMANVLQADQALLRFNRHEALRRRFVVDVGYLKNLQFDTPRTISGRIGSQQPFAGVRIGWFPDAFERAMSDTATQFLDRVAVRKSVETSTQSAITQVAAEIREAIPAWFVDALELSRGVSHQIATITQQLTDAPGNPLREPERVRAIAVQLPEVERSMQETRANAQRIQSDFEKQLERLQRAKQADLASTKCRVAVADLKPDVLKSLLTSRQQLAQVDESLQWVRWLRESIPAGTDEFNPRAATGVDVQFQPQRQPDLTIRELKFEGSALVGGSAQRMFGTLSNWTLPPAGNSVPVGVEIRVQGASHLLLSAELDRRAGARRDHIRLSRPEIQATGQTLGRDGVMQLAVGTCRQIVDAELHIDGDQVDGTIRFRHAEAALRLTELHELAGGDEMLHWLNRELAGVRQFETALRLSGTLDDIRVACDCELGTILAAAAAKATGSTIGEPPRDHQTKIERDYSAAVALLTTEFSQRHRALAAQLQQDGSRLHALRQTAARNATDQPFRR